MNFFLLYRARLVSSLRNPLALLFIVLAVAVSSAAALTANEKNSSALTVAIVAEDTGESSDRLIRLLHDTESFSMTQMPREKALLRLRQDRLEAVIIIPWDFSEKIERAEFRNTLELYASPSSQAVATVSEPLINAVLMLWMEEYTLQLTGGLLSEQGIAYDENEESALRETIRSIWESGSLIRLNNVVLEPVVIAEPNNASFDYFVRWYGILCLFYLIVSATWVLDAGKRSLRARIAQTGASRWILILTTGAAPLTLCLAGYFAGGMVFVALNGAPPFAVILFLLPMLLYLFALLGITMFAASLARSTIQLMFLAPLLTFFNGTLSGLFTPLPQWAYVLEILSRGLPGRWLSRSLSAPIAALAPASICAAAWLAAGVALSLAFSGWEARRKKRGAL